MTRDDHEFHELVLGCESWQEAQRLTELLLQNKLVQAVEALELRSRRWWDYPFGQKYQIKLIIQTLEQDAKAVKTEIFHLRRNGSNPPYTIPLARLSRDVTVWLRRATEIKSATLKR